MGDLGIPSLVMGTWALETHRARQTWNIHLTTVPGLTLVIVCLFCSKAVVPNWEQFYLQGNMATFGNVWRHFATPGLELPLSSGQRPRLLLNILRWLGQPPTAKNYLAQTVTGVEVEKPCCGSAFWDWAVACVFLSPLFFFYLKKTKTFQQAKRHKLYS